MLNTKEHQELIAAFERNYGKGLRLDKEGKELWKNGHIYQSPETNIAFNFFSKGYAYGKCCHQ